MDNLAFKRAMGERRRIVSFGSNDGLLHAVNMGFGGTLAEGRVKYALQSVSSPLTPAHELGAELWAFIPKGNPAPVTLHPPTRSASAPIA
jgi:Tfp pilus tip-associated adhesin PilY1